MAGGINKVILIGNLGRDPETRYTQSGDPVANFSIATSESWTDRNTNERQERTEWHNIVCFRGLAKICADYLHKGSKVYIEGRLQTRSWEGQDGQTRYRTEVVARDMQMLDSRGAGGPAGAGGGGAREEHPPPAAQGQRRPEPAAPAAAETEDFDDDIPF